MARTVSGADRDPLISRTVIGAANNRAETHRAVNAAAESLGLQPPTPRLVTAVAQIIPTATYHVHLRKIYNNCKLDPPQPFCGWCREMLGRGHPRRPRPNGARARIALLHSVLLLPALAMLSSDDDSEDGAPPDRGRVAMPSPLKKA